MKILKLALDFPSRYLGPLFLNCKRKCVICSDTQGYNNDKKICREMVCYRPDKRSCFKKEETRAVDGTSCGNNQWCMKGRCVPNNNEGNNNEGKVMELLAQIANLLRYYNLIPTVGAVILVFFEIDH